MPCFLSFWCWFLVGTIQLIKTPVLQSHRRHIKEENEDDDDKPLAMRKKMKTEPKEKKRKKIKDEDEDDDFKPVGGLVYAFVMFPSVILFYTEDVLIYRRMLSFIIICT